MGYSASEVEQSAELSFGMQHLTADLDRFGIDEDESDYTRFASAIDPVMDGTALHEHVPGL